MVNLEGLFFFMLTLLAVGWCFILKSIPTLRADQVIFGVALCFAYFL